MEKQQELHKARPRVLPFCTCRKTITRYLPPLPGLEDVVWTSVSSCENKGTEMRRKSLKRCGSTTPTRYLSPSLTQQKLRLGRGENPTHFAAIKSSGPRRSQERGHTHSAGHRCDLSIQPEWPRLL